MAKKIKVWHGATSKLAKEFGIHRNCVAEMLQFKYNTERAEAVRKAAMERYGGKIVNNENK